MNCKSGNGIWDNSGITFSFVLVPFNIRSFMIVLKKPAFLRVCERKVVLDMVGVTGSIPVAPTIFFKWLGSFGDPLSMHRDVLANFRYSVLMKGCDAIFASWRS